MAATESKPVDVAAQMQALLDASDATDLEKVHAIEMAKKLHQVADVMGSLSTSMVSTRGISLDGARLVRLAFLIGATLAQDDKIATPMSTVARGLDTCTCRKCRRRRLLDKLKTFWRGGP